jgi:hypothetical protein
MNRPAHYLFGQQRNPPSPFKRLRGKAGVVWVDKEAEAEAVGSNGGWQ